MNTRRNAAGRLEEEIANAEAPPHGDQFPPIEKGETVGLSPINPPPLTDENMRVALLQMAQTITTQAQASTAQAQAMTTQENGEVVPYLN